ncbi:MAG: MarR family winged helix-turn-helix transcriptional regulator [Acidimicrobiales bacterium]
MSDGGLRPCGSAGAVAPASGAACGSSPPAPTASIDPVDALRESLARLLGADRRLKGRLARGGDTLAHTHLRALFLLLQEGEATAGTLARVTDLNPASVTAMIDQLERRGLLERRRHAQDRRVCLVTLTETGRHQVTAEERAWRARLHQALGDIGEDELRTAARVLERLRAAMDETAGPS